MKRAIVLGNGPSLRGFDFDSLRGEFVIACNRIHLIYPKTEWRPTVYVMTDASGNEEAAADCRFHVRQGYPFYITNRLVHHAFNPQERPQAPHRCWPFYNEPTLKIIENCDHEAVRKIVPLKWHLPHICCYGGSVFAGVQIAAFVYGFKEIELLGVDGAYTIGRNNHFIDDYLPTFEYTQDYVDMKNIELATALEIAKRGCKELGVTLVRKS